MLDLTGIYISTNVIGIIINLFIICIVFYLMYSLIKEEEKVDFGELIVEMFKAIAYTLFAFIIYICYKNKQSIDITTLFTFIFSVLESAHNVSIVLEKLVVLQVKIIFKDNVMAAIIAAIIIAGLYSFGKYNYKYFEESTQSFLKEKELIYEDSSKVDEDKNNNYSKDVLN